MRDLRAAHSALNAAQHASSARSALDVPTCPRALNTANDDERFPSQVAFGVNSLDHPRRSKLVSCSAICRRRTQKIWSLCPWSS